MNQQKDAAQRNQAVWGANPAGWTHAQEHKKGTKEFFEKVVQARFAQEHYWLADFVQYHDFKGKKVLEIGCGAGYDAYMFCASGANYTGIDITAQNIALTQQHLALYNLPADVIQMDATQLEFEEKFDLVYSFGVVHHIPEIGKVLDNVHRVLADDGSFYCVVYNKNSVFYWLSLYLCKYLWQQGYKKRSFQEELAAIEITESKEHAHVDVYTKKSFKKLLRNHGFECTHVSIQQLFIENFPLLPRFKRWYPFSSQKLWSYLGTFFGWYICIKAQKIKK